MAYSYINAVVVVCACPHARLLSLIDSETKSPGEFQNIRNYPHRGVGITEPIQY